MVSNAANRMRGKSLLGWAIGAKQIHARSAGGLGTLLPSLSYADECRALMLKDAGDLRARNLLVEHNLRLVIYIARRFIDSGIHIEDLISVGTMGLIKGVNSYKFGKNAKLATYASRCIENEILMALRRIRHSRMDVSLDKPITVDWNGNELLLSDIFVGEEDLVSRDLDRSEDHRLLHEAIRALSPKEQKVIALRFGLYDGSVRTQGETAAIVGVSQSYISKLEKRIIKQLHTALHANFLR